MIRARRRGAALQVRRATRRCARRQRLAIDLYESRPPSPAAEIRRAPDGCLSLRRFAIGPRRVTASGRELHLFEHSLIVRLRRAGGRVHAPARDDRGRAPLEHDASATRARAAAAGTLEAVALSAKDGTLDCLTQVRVRFGG